MFASYGSSDELGDNGYDFCGHETDSELQDRLVRSVWCRGHETSGFQCSSECLGAESAQASLYRYPLRFSFRGRRQWAQPSKSAVPQVRRVGFCREGACSGEGKATRIS